MRCPRPAPLSVLKWKCRGGGWEGGGGGGGAGCGGNHEGGIPNSPLGFLTFTLLVELEPESDRLAAAEVAVAEDDDGIVADHESTPEELGFRHCQHGHCCRHRRGRRRHRLPILLLGFQSPLFCSKT